MIFTLAAITVVSILAGIIAAALPHALIGRSEHDGLLSLANVVGIIALFGVCYWLTWTLNPDPLAPGTPPSNSTVLPVVGMELVVAIPIFTVVSSRLERLKKAVMERRAG